MGGPDGNRVTKWLACAVGLLLIAAVVALRTESARRDKPRIDKVIVGTRDEVYYSRGASMQEATALGHALEGTGFFGDRGTSVLLSRNHGIAVISFVMNDGAWDRPEAVATFEEIGRRVAGAVGGFPIEVRLVDAKWAIRKSLVVGKTAIGKDSVYYLGAATENEAKALGQALREAGYLQDLGASVELSKGDTTVLAFVVDRGVWDRPEAVAGFERLARMVARTVGGPPLELRLLSAEMETEKSILISR